MKVFLLSQGTCNGCELEFHACFAPRYGAGFEKAESIEQAEVVVVTGCGTEKASVSARREFKKSWGKPVLVGNCAINGGIFRCRHPRIRGKIKVVGCPPRPEQIIAAIEEATKCPK